MCSLCSRFVVIVVLAVGSFAAPRQHTVALGHWRVVKAANEDGREQRVRVRPLFIDGRLREYTTGTPHDVTDRLFVVRRIRRVNDSLPGESADKPQWLWQFDTWLSVDRLTGHIAQLNFPAFDPDISQTSWYRDYAAYCGPSEGGDKMYMVVVQLGRRKPILKKPFAGVSCAAPVWERNPSSVTFDVGSEKSRFVVHALGVSPGTEPESGEEGPQ